MWSSSEPRARSEGRVAALELGLGLLTLALVVAAAARLPVLPDEAYYWTWSRQLEWAYFDHPPTHAWVLAASTRVFGDSPLALRLPSLLAMLGALGFVGASARRLAPESAAAPRLAARLLLASPMFLAGLIPATPDGLLALGAAFAGWCLIRALELGGWLAWGRLGFALTLLVGLKHYGLLLAAGAGLGLALSVEARRRVRAGPFALGALAALALLGPWLWAELELGAASSVAFQLQRVLHGRPRFAGPISVPVTVGSMIGTLGPVGALGLLGLGFGALRTGAPAARSLFTGAWALLLACFAAVWLGSGEANWPLPALVLAAPPMAVSLARLRRRGLLIAGLATGQGLVLVYLAHLAVPFLPLPLAKDPSARGAGHAALAATVQERARAVGAVAVGARTYQLTSLLRYHLRDQSPVFELGLDRASQYDRWSAPSLCSGDRVVIVTQSIRAGMPAHLLLEDTPTSWVRRAPARGGAEYFKLSAARVVGDGRCRVGGTE